MKAIAASGTGETLPVSDVSPIYPRKMSEDFIASHSGNDAPRIAFVAQPATDFNREVGELEHPLNTTQLAQLLLGPISLANTDEHLTRRWVSISVSGSALQIAPPLETFPKHISKELI